MRVLACGSRDWSDGGMVNAVLTGLYQEATVGHLSADLVTFTLIEGGARGADSCAAWWADNSPMHSHNEHPDHPRFEHLTFRADWERYGKRAGYLRNQQMLDEGKPDLVLAFRSPGESPGTDMMVDLAHKAGVPAYVIRLGRCL